MLTIKEMRGTPSDRQAAYIRDLLEQRNAELAEIAAVAPKSAAAVEAAIQHLLDVPHSDASWMIDTLQRDNILGEAYRHAERVIRDKEEKKALHPMYAAAMQNLNAIPPRRGGN